TRPSSWWPARTSASRRSSRAIPWPPSPWPCPSSSGESWRCAEPRGGFRKPTNTVASFCERWYARNVQDPKRTLWYLRKIPLLADLGPEVLARLAERIQLREVKRREVVYLPGDPGASCFVVNGGRIKISKVTR